MSEKEKEIMQKMKTVLPVMSEFDKGYMLGMIDSNQKKVADQQTSETKQETPAAQ